MYNYRHVVYGPIRNENQINFANYFMATDTDWLSIDLVG